MIKGSKMTLESRLKMSLVRKGVKKSEEHKRKIGLANKGFISNKTVQAARLANTGRKASEETKRKMSKVRRGKKLSEYHKMRMRLAYAGKRFGKNNANWIEDRNLIKKSEDRRKDYAHKVWRHECKIRDQFKCKINNLECNGRLEVHHILRWSDYPELRYDLNNGITLCHFHHPFKNSEEDRLVSTFRKLLLN